MMPPQAIAPAYVRILSRATRGLFSSLDEESHES